MNKKVLFAIIFVLLFVFLLFAKQKKRSATFLNTKKRQNITLISVTPPPAPLGVQKKSIFIPYWALGQGNYEKKYNEYYYFGITPNGNGEIEDEQGKKNMELIDNALTDKTTLVLRMMDKNSIDLLMGSVTVHERLVQNIRNILKENGMKGVALDMEIPFSLNTERPIQITNFVQKICSSIKSDYKTCDLIVYGDVFYHGRPYDISSLAGIVDKVLIMAYDFHKSSGEPGPNFSFEGKEKYGYDFKTMLRDFSSVVPKEKLVVIFGMYGYDWTLNEQGIPLKSAEALTLIQIKNKISSFVAPYNKIAETGSGEKAITYVDGNGRKHIMWWEDEESARIKAEYLKTQGIAEVSYWANGYF